MIVADLVQSGKQKLLNAFLPHSVRGDRRDYSHLDINFHTNLIRQVATPTEQNLFLIKAVVVCDHRYV